MRALSPNHCTAREFLFIFPFVFNIINLFISLIVSLYNLILITAVFNNQFAKFLKISQ